MYSLVLKYLQCLLTQMLMAKKNSIQDGLAQLETIRAFYLDKLSQADGELRQLNASFTPSVAKNIQVSRHIIFQNSPAYMIILNHRMSYQMT